MKSLRTARVLIIDDTRSEAMPIVEALGRLGIGCVYVSGEKIEELETLKPFSGIRVAFVDMKLGIEGTAKEVVGKTVNVLKAALAHDCSPVIFIAWTQHPEYVATFMEVVRLELPSIQPLIVHRMPKPIRADGTISVPATLRNLKRILSEHWPLSLLWDLEQRAHEATTETTQTISEVVSKDSETSLVINENPPAGAWFRALQKIFQKLIVAGAGKNDEDRASQRGLLEAFSAMQFDRFQDSGPYLTKDISKLRQLPRPKLSAEQMAVLNSMLLLSTPHKSELSVKPGNLYQPRPRLKLKCPVTRCAIKVAELTLAMPLRLTKDAEWKKLDDDLQKARRQEQPDEASRLEKAAAIRKREILKHCIPVLLELTPACDHAQSKADCARFVAGILIPNDHAKIFDLENDEPPFLRRVEPLVLPEKDGLWHLVLNARALHTITNARRKIRSAPLTRLREGLQNDLRAWFATHAARPGYLSVR